MTTEIHTASCMCGAIKLAAAGPPPNSLNIAIVNGVSSHLALLS